MMEAEPGGMSDKEMQFKYKAENAARTLMEVQELKKNQKLMAAAKQILAEKAKVAVAALADAGKAKVGKTLMDM